MLKSLTSLETKCIIIITMLLMAIFCQKEVVLHIKDKIQIEKTEYMLENREGFLIHANLYDSYS